MGLLTKLTRGGARGQVHVDTTSRVYNRMLRHTDQPDLVPENAE